MPCFLWRESCILSRMTTTTRAQEFLERVHRFLAGEDRRPILSVCHQQRYRQMEDEDEMVKVACEVLHEDIADGVPLPTFLADFGTVSTAALFGGAIVPANPDSGAMKYIHPVTDDVAEVLAMTPRRFEESDFQKGLDLYRRVCATLGSEAPDGVFLRTPDFQGALNTLSLVVNQTELMVAMVERPEVVKAALNHIVDILIAYYKRFYAEAGKGRVLGNIWPFIVLQEQYGVVLTEDYMPLLGAEHYEEFGLPPLKRVSDAFGGVHAHCCGNYRQHLKAMRASGVKYLGLEVYYPERMEDVYATFGDSVYLVPGLTAVGQREFGSVAALIRSWKGMPHARGRYWIPWCYEWGDVDDLRNAIAEVLQ